MRKYSIFRAQKLNSRPRSPQTYKSEPLPNLTNMPVISQILIFILFNDDIGSLKQNLCLI